MNDALPIFLVGFSSGFVLAWVIAVCWLFRLEDKEGK